MSMDDEKPFTKLVIENVRCFGKTEVPLHPRVTVVIGENGTGKTTVAEALASMSYGEGEGLAKFPLRHGAKKGRIALYEAGSKKPAAVWAVGTKEERRRLAEKRYLFAYGRYRRVRFPRQPERRQSEAELFDTGWEAGATPAGFPLREVTSRPRTPTLTRPDNHLLRDLDRYLSELHIYRSFDPRADAAWRQIDASLPVLGQGLERLEVEEVDGELVPKIVRSGVKLCLGELSDGFQAVLVVVFDLILRFFFLFTPLENPLEGRALVVIDEVDLHLHPRWQRGVLGQLAQLFPRAQFVVTTHSPAVVQGAIDRGFQVVVLREGDGQAEVFPLNSGVAESLRGAEIGAVWMEDRLFDVSSRYSQRVEADEEEVRKLRMKLEEDEESKEDRLRLIELLDKLGLLLAKDEERQGRGPFLSELARSQVEFLRRLEKMANEEDEE